MIHSCERLHESLGTTAVNVVRLEKQLLVGSSLANIRKCVWLSFLCYKMCLTSAFWHVVYFFVFSINENLGKLADVKSTDFHVLPTPQ